MQSNEVNKYLRQSLKRNANNPDEDAQGENDKDECAKDGSHEVKQSFLFIFYVSENKTSLTKCASKQDFTV